MPQPGSCVCALCASAAYIRCRTQRWNRFNDETSAAAPAAHTRYVSSPPAATLHGKTQGFVLRLPPQHKSHATFMQPLQRVLQQHLHIHAAHYTTICIHSLQNTGEEPIRPRNDRSRTRRTQERFIAVSSHFTRKNTRFCAPASILPNTSFMQHSCSHYNALCSNTYTSMQPLHYDLHPLVAEHRGTDSAPKRPQPHPPHTGGTFPTLHGKTQGFVLRLRSSPTQASCNIHAAITMRFAATPTHPCSHYITICIHSLQNTEEEPIRPRNGRSRTRRTQEVPFIAACSHFTRRNTRFRAPLPPQHKSHATFNAFCSNTYTSMQPLHHDLHPLAYATFMQPVQCLFHYNAFCGNTYTSIKSLTTLHECIVMGLKVSQSHAALHDVLLCDVKVSQSHTTLHDVLLCDVNSHSLTPPCVNVLLQYVM